MVGKGQMADLRLRSWCAFLICFFARFCCVVFLVFTEGTPRAASVTMHLTGTGLTLPAQSPGPRLPRRPPSRPAPAPSSWGTFLSSKGGVFRNETLRATIIYLNRLSFCFLFFSFTQQIFSFFFSVFVASLRYLNNPREKVSRSTYRAGRMTHCSRT